MKRKRSNTPAEISRTCFGKDDDDDKEKVNNPRSDAAVPVKRKIDDAERSNDTVVDNLGMSTLTL